MEEKNLTQVLGGVQTEPADLLQDATAYSTRPRDPPSSVIRRRIEEIWEMPEFSGGSDDAGNPPKIHDRGDGGDGSNQKDVILEPADRIKSNILNNLLVLVVVILLGVAVSELVITIHDYVKFSNFLNTSTDLAAYEALVEAAKPITDLAMARLNDVVKVAIGILITLVIKLIDDLGKKKQ
jgi:hypothetical protein